MREEIRQPNKVVWVVVGGIALLLALLMVISERLGNSIRKEPTPPFALKFFIPPPTPPNFDLAKALGQLEQTPHDITLLVEVQAYSASQQKWDKALEIGKTIVRSSKGSHEVNAYLGNIYALANKGKLEEATKWAILGLQKVSDRAGRAQLRRALGDLSLMHWEATDDLSYFIDASTHYQLALQEWSQVPLAKAHLAYIKFKRGETELAQKLIDAVLQSPEAIEREKAIATYYLAQIKASQGDTAEANRLYERSEQLHPDSFNLEQSNPTHNEGRL